MSRPVQLPWIAFVTVSVASAAAVAQPTKVALTIDGDSSSIGLRKAVVGALDDSDVEFVSAKKTTRAIEQLGIGEVTSARDARTLAAKLDVETVVQGAFDDSAHKLKLTIFTKGKKGSSSFTLVVDDTRSKEFRKAVRRKMLAKIAVASADDDDKPAKPAKKTAVTKKHADEAASDEAADSSAESDADTDSGSAAEPRHESKATHKERHAKHVASEADGEDPDADAAADRDEPPTSAHARVEGPRADSAVHGMNLAAIRLDLGASMTGRSLKFASSSFDAAPSSYRNKPVPGGRIEAELYPAALSDRTSLLACLGIAGDFDQAASLTIPSADGMSLLKVTERHYSVGARFRIPFGHRATSPTLTLGVGYGARTFAVDHTTGMAIDLPDVDYRMVDPGLAARVPLGRRVSLTAGGRALLLTSAGAIANADQYGRAHVPGGSASAGIEVMIGNHLALRVAGEATQLDLKFYGSGMLSTSRDGDPSTIDVHGAVDRYYGGDATLALLY